MECRLPTFTLCSLIPRPSHLETLKRWEGLGTRLHPMAKTLYVYTYLREEYCNYKCALHAIYEWAGRCIVVKVSKQ